MCGQHADSAASARVAVGSFNSISAAVSKVSRVRNVQTLSNPSPVTAVAASGASAGDEKPTKKAALTSLLYFEQDVKRIGLLSLLLILFSDKAHSFYA